MARFHPKGYYALSALTAHSNARLGTHCFLGEDVVIYEDVGGGRVTLSDGVHLHRDTVIQTGKGGSVDIGRDTHIQPRCQISAYLGAVAIGERVEIAPNCAFYPYNHGIDAGTPVHAQPLQSAGRIMVEDDAWIGSGAIALDGIRIGRGAIIGAGAVVMDHVSSEGIAAGVPARLIGTRRLRGIREETQ